jgi:hypothetical protein
MFSRHANLQRTLFIYCLYYFSVSDVYAIDVPTDCFLRGKEATFKIKRSKWSVAHLDYIWKLNGKEMSEKENFTHTFNTTGRYNACYICIPCHLYIV